MRLTASGALFLMAAFPFVIPLVPSTDTQPTFTVLVAAFVILAAVASFDRQVPIRKTDVVLAAWIVAGGLVWLSLSFVANGFAVGNVNRVVSFIMMLIAVATGLINRHIFTADRILLALKVYLLFTAIFFMTSGAIEGVLIRARGEDALSQLTSTGRGASTLSPEPSFFAFQIFTLFLAARLTVWTQLPHRARHMVQLMTIALLLASLGGYGILYAAAVIFLSGWRYMLGATVAGGIGAIILLGNFSIDSLRFIQLATTLLADATSGDGRGIGVTDISTLGRLNSFIDYLRAFNAHLFFGDAFATYGGSGLVSLLAGVGLFGVVLNLTFLVAILVLRTGVKVKLALLLWFILQFISGPIGLPMVGLLIGLVIGTSRIGPFLDAVRLARSRAAQPSFT